MSDRVKRYDAAAKATKAERMANGWMRVDGRISRVGVQTYQGADGKPIRELRLPEEVFSASSLASFDMVPLTNQHPPGLLDAATTRQHQIGTVKEAVRDGDYVAAPMVIYDADAIAAVEAGRSQLSCGYLCELEGPAGVHPTFGPYDVIQRRIAGNHVALVDTARAGPGARLRLDAGDAEQIPNPTESPKETTPMQIKIDGLALDATDANAPAIQAAHDKVAAQVAAANAARDAAQAKADTAEAARAELAAKLDAATNPATMAALVRARVALEVEAGKHVSGAKFDGLSDRDVRALVVEKLAGVKLDAEKSSEYVAARYDAEIERAAKAPTAIDLARGPAVVQQTADATDPRAAYVAKQYAAFKPAR